MEFPCDFLPEVLLAQLALALGLLHAVIGLLHAVIGLLHVEFRLPDPVLWQE